MMERFGRCSHSSKYSRLLPWVFALCILALAACSDTHDGQTGAIADGGASSDADGSGDAVPDASHELVECGTADTVVEGQFAIYTLDPDCEVLLGSLEIARTDTTDLSELPALQEIGGVFSVLHNDALESVQGLGSLEHVGGDFRLVGNDVLSDLSALTMLQGVGQSLTIQSNPSLNSLHGLENVKSVGRLVILENSSLADLAGLSGLEHVGGDVVIKTNAELSQSEVESFLAGLQVDGEVRTDF